MFRGYTYEMGISLSEMLERCTFKHLFYILYKQKYEQEFNICIFSEIVEIELNWI